MLLNVVVSQASPPTVPPLPIWHRHGPGTEGKEGGGGVGSATPIMRSSVVSSWSCLSSSECSGCASDVGDVHIALRCSCRVLVLN